MYNSDFCIICKYPITDPVCRNCYIKQISMLLSDLNLDSIIKDYIKNKLKNTLNPESMNDDECIICKKNTLSTCRYCFSLVLIRILRELNFTEDIIDDFGYKPLYGEVSQENESISDIEELEMEMRKHPYTRTHNF